MRKNKLILALNLALGLAILPAPALLAAERAPITQAQVSVPEHVGRAMQLEAIATGLASFHDIDASFSDTLRLASSASYGPTFLGSAWRGETDADDSDLPYGVRPCHGCGASGEPGSAAPTGANLSGDGADLNPNLLSPDQNAGPDSPTAGGYQGDNFLLGLGYDFAEDGSGQNPAYRVDDEVWLAQRAQASAIGDADDSDFDDSDSELSPVAMRDQVQAANQLMASRLASEGAISRNADGSLSIDWDRLAEEFGARITDDKGIQTLVGLNPLETEPSLKTVTDSQLQRLSDRPFELQAGLLPEVSSDGATVRVFSSRLEGEGAGRQVLLANSGQQTDMLLQDQGLGLNRRAYRVTDPLAGGLQRVRTAFATQLADGSLLEVLEDRYVEASGKGSGAGIFQLQDQRGATVRGELRTLVRSDGSLISYLDLNGGPDMLIHESSQGQARLALLDQGTASDWVPLDLSGLLRLPSEGETAAPEVELEHYQPDDELY